MTWHSKGLNVERIKHVKQPFVSGYQRVREVNVTNEVYMQPTLCHICLSYEKHVERCLSLPAMRETFDGKPTMLCNTRLHYSETKIPMGITTARVGGIILTFPGSRTKGLIKILKLHPRVFLLTETSHL